MNSSASNQSAGSLKLPHPGNRARDDALDATKGVLIVLVIIGHFIQFCSPAGPPGLTFETLPFWNDPIFKAIYIFHMPAFFLVSGRLFSRLSSSAVTLQVTRRARQLLLPIFAWTLVFHTVLYLRTVQHTGSLVPLGATLFNITDGIQHDFWFPWTLFSCFSLAAIVRKFLPLGGAGLVLSFVALALVPGFNLLKFGYFFFVAGSYWGNTDLSSAKSARWLYVLLPISLAGWFLWDTNTYIYITGMTLAADNGLNILKRLVFGTTWAVSFLTVCALLFKGRRIPWLSLLGRESFGIYLLQIYALIVLTRIPFKLAGSFSFTVGVTPLLALTLALVLALGCVGLAKNRFLGALFLGHDFAASPTGWSPFRPFRRAASQVVPKHPSSGT